MEAEAIPPDAGEGAAPPPPRPGGGWLGAWVLVLAVALGFLHNLGAAPLTDRDEGAFSEATREMFERGDFISTYLNGEPRYDKPILIYWLQAATTSLFGFNEWGFRFPSALAGILWALAVASFVRNWTDERTGLYAGIVTATTLWIMVLSRAATADGVLNLFIVLATFAAFNYAKEERRTDLWIFYGAVGLGFLTKGPVGAVIPAGASFVFALFSGRLKPWFRALLSPSGWFIFLAINAPWYTAQYLKEGQAFIDGFFLKHNVSRFTDTMEGHGGSYFYYVPVLFLITLPWTGLLVRLLVRTAGRIRSAFRDELDLFLWGWFGFVFVLFSVSGTQLPHYIVPGLTPLIVLMARYREELRRAWPSLALPALILALLLVFPTVWPSIEGMVEDDNAVAMLSGRMDVFGAGYRITLGVALLVLAWLGVTTRLKPWNALVAGSLVFTFAVTHAVVPAAGELVQGPTKEAALLAKEEGWDVVMWSVDMPSFAVYYDAVTPLRAPRPGEVVFTRSTRIDGLDDVEILYEKGIVVLARKKAPPRLMPGDAPGSP